MVVFFSRSSDVRAALTSVSDSASSAEVAIVELAGLKISLKSLARTFVENQDIRVLHECSCNGYPLLLPARELSSSRPDMCI